MTEQAISEAKEMERLANDVDEINKRVSLILTSASNINDRFFGDIPRDEKGSDTLARPGAIGCISDKLEHLRDMLNKLEAETDKASKIV